MFGVTLQGNVPHFDFVSSSIHPMEFPAVECSVFSFSACLLSTSKGIPLPEVSPFVSLLHVWRSRELQNSSAILATLTNIIIVTTTTTTIIIVVVIVVVAVIDYS